MTYIPSPTRYDTMAYRRCGKSGLLLPALSLGLWHNFGSITPFETQQAILRTAFDNGITHFDLANNYGPPYGEAERNFGVHMLRDWKPHRDELVISTKAGYDMWPGPYGNWGSRKYLMASLDQSLCCLCGSNISGDDRNVRESCLDLFQRSHNVLAVAVCRVQHQNVYLRIHQSVRTLQHICSDADGSAAEQAAHGILGGIRVFDLFLNILNCDKSL